MMEQSNGSIHYLMLCDVMIDQARPLTNYKLPDDIISGLAESLKIKQRQYLFAAMGNKLTF